MGIEKELKLVFDAEDLASIRAFSDLSFGAPKVRKLQSVYYDTADRKLLSKGLSFRVRHNGSGYRQTLKSEDKAASGALVREEYECAVPSTRPRPDAFEEKGEAVALLRDIAGDLKPAFKVEVERASYDVSFAGRGNVAVEIDVGVVKAGRKRSAIHEIEIEAKSAESADLYRLARDFSDAAALRLSTLTKSQRGFELMRGAVPTSAKAGKVELKQHTTVEQALGLIFDNGLAQLVANERCLLETDDPEGIHQMRVGLRRLRSAFRTFRPLLPDAVVDGHPARLGRLARAFEPARDWDVFHLELVQPACRQFPAHRGLQLLSRRVQEKRKAARADAARVLRWGDFTPFLLDCQLWVSERQWRGQPLTPSASRLFASACDFAVPSLAKRHRKVCKLAAAAANGSPEERHALRIEIKKLRYALDFFVSLFPKAATKRYAKVLGCLQDELGHLNDVTVARSLGDRIVDEAAPEDRRALSEAVGYLLGWNISRQGQSEKAINRDIREVLAAKVPWRA